MQLQLNKLRQKCADRIGAPAGFRGDQRAFTLAEVIVSVLVLATMSLSLFGGFSTGFMIVDSAREDLRANQILMQKTEAIRLCTWSSLSNCPISFVERYDPNSTNSAGTVYNGTVTTSRPNAIPDTAAYKTNMCMATVTVYWTNYYGGQSIVRTRQLQTFIARYGIQNYIWGTVP